MAAYYHLAVQGSLEARTLDQLPGLKPAGPGAMAGIHRGVRIEIHALSLPLGRGPQLALDHGDAQQVTHYRSLPSDAGEEQQRART